LSGLDLGIAGRRALVCGSSSGLGEACATALAQAGVEVVMNGRRADRLSAAAARVAQASGRAPAQVVADVASAEGREALVAAAGAVDILVNNGGGPPPGRTFDLTPQQWEAALQGSMLAPIALMQALVPPMAARGWGRVINVTSSSAKSPIPMLGLSNGARAGLTGFVAGLAREVAGQGVTINNLLPGPFATDRLMAVLKAQGGGATTEAAAEAAAREVPVGRLGEPAEFGVWCAFLASEHAGFVTGQNFLLDGGRYPGVF
jgi:3-oxoacyl-[acyl-carrier protein] reductase